MRKFLTFLIALAAIVGATASSFGGSMMLLGVGKAPSGGGGGCTQATNFFNRLAAVTPTPIALDSTHTTAYTNLICGLVTDGLITGAMTGAQGSGADCNSVAGTGFFDGLYIFATNVTAGSVTALTEMNLCGTSFTLTDNNTLTAHFTADRGYVPAVGTDYFETSFNPSTATSPTFKLNTAHFAVWNNSNAINSVASMGTGNTTSLNHMYIQFASGQFYSRLDDSSASSQYTIVNPQGLLIGNRSSSSAVQAYQGSTALSGPTTSTAGSAVNNATMWIFAQNGAVADTFHQLGAASFGGSLSSGQATSYYARMKTYMTAVGVCGVITCP